MALSCANEANMATKSGAVLSEFGQAKKTLPALHML
jgi:hypothetical protein